jgi:hypothetical protein
MGEAPVMGKIFSQRNWLIIFALCLILISLSLFSISYLIYHDLNHIFIYTLHDLAFLPIEVLLVTIIIHQLIEGQAIKAKLEKMDMVIGIFFSEVGTPLLHYFAQHDPAKKEKTELFISVTSWDMKTYDKKIKESNDFKYLTSFECEDLPELKEILVSRKEMLVRLLENPVLFEHEAFTELLRAVFHLTEELIYRNEFSHLPASDIRHLSGDIIRVYSELTHSWLAYLKYLKQDYPYLYSLASRTNPFRDKTDVIVRD